ncbi:MAG: lipase family protein [Perlucidibaca sp.]
MERPRKIHGIAVITTCLLLAACNGGGGNNSGDSDTVVVSASTVPYPPTPDSDAFYAQPSTLPSVTPGTILGFRTVTFAPLGIPLPNEAWQLQFLSKDVNGRPIAAIATVIKPLIPRVGGAVLLSHQFAEDSLGSRCAPSHTLTGGQINPLNDAELSKTTAALALGWTVVVPDHEGPNSAFAAGRLHAHITLDGIRAALQFAPLGLSASTPVGLIGYSGGGIASAWAASYQPSYAPELNLVGAAVGAPATNLIEVARNADTNPVTNAVYFSLVLGAIQGINRAFPQLVTPYLNDKGKATFEAMKDGCVGGTSGVGGPYFEDVTGGINRPTGHFDDYTSVPNLLDAPSTKALAPLINLPQSGHSPTTDVFLYHAATDELLLVAGTDETADAWCADGTPLHYYRLPVGEHIATDVLVSPFAITYLSSRFAGSQGSFPPGTTSCDTSD